MGHVAAIRTMIVIERRTVTYQPIYVKPKTPSNARAQTAPATQARPVRDLVPISSLACGIAIQDQPAITVVPMRNVHLSVNNRQTVFLIVVGMHAVSFIAVHFGV
jgi:hypothetical protein